MFEKNVSLPLSTKKMILQHVATALKRGVPGAIAGSAAGFVLSVSIGVINSLFGAQKPTLSYMYKGKETLYENMKTVQDLNVEDDLEIIAVHRHHNPIAHDKAARLVQHIINLNLHFLQARAEGKDGLKELAKLICASKKSDTAFRELYYKVKTKNNEAMTEEVLQAIMNLHFSWQRLISYAQESFSVQTLPVDADVNG